jgi:FlaA1/EpsC-like NDP-sugar epimerase
MVSMSLLHKCWSQIKSLIPAPRWLTWAAQIALFCLSGVAAFLIRFEFLLPAPAVTGMLWAVAVWVVLKSAVFALLGLHKGWWRFVSVPDVIRICTGNLVASVLSAVVLVSWAPGLIPKSVYVIDLILCIHFTAGIRLLARVIKEYAVRSRLADAKPVLIYGAGSAGVALLREIQANPKLNYEVRGFIDDNPSKRGMLIHRVPILGSGRDLARAAKRTGATDLLLAIPSATGPQMTEALRRATDSGLRCKTIPGMGELIEENHLARQIRDVAVDDLLGRTPVHLDLHIIRARIAGSAILVTGAAGSIGSELCRQIARFNPGSIIAFDAAETPLFHIENEIHKAFPQIPFVPEIGSIQNPQRLADVFARHRPSMVFHAAAYKHVPMMEAHPFEAVENNVFGTWNLALAAQRADVADFVMISSDKAVRPTNVMGATKRLAELIINGMESDGSGASTKFVSVRFGNVLGSNGSVVPIFKSQIAAGGPVTVTHPEMRRYFMTIPEAVQLVLQASTMGHGGEIFVLDMGQPVKILDLATNLILLSGFRPGEDIRIEFTGIRPGEKLYEELHAFDETTLPTPHEKIKIFAANGLPPGGMEPHLDTLLRICASRDSRRLLLELKDLIPDYNPSSQLLRGALDLTLAASA